MLNAIRSEASRFENVLQSLRVSRGKSWTREKMAEELTIYDGREVKLRLYTCWENGEGVPSPENLKKIVAVLGLIPDEAEKLFHAAMRVPPSIRHLPFPPNPFFTGRKSYLKQIRKFLQENDTLALTQPVSISGLGGIGKTQLALAYAYFSYQKVYRVVLWVNASDPTTLQADYDTLSRKLGLSEELELKLKPEQRVEFVKQWLDDHTHWLLIMDNADDLELARSFFPASNHGHILLTTRLQFARKIGARPLEIDKMKRAEGLVFLLRRTGWLEGNTNLKDLGTDIRGPALQLVKLLDGHPLALDQAGAYIDETDKSFTNYINLYQKQRLLYLGKYGALEDKQSEHAKYSQHPETVVVTFKLCFEMAHKQHLLAADLLNFCAFLHPDDIPEELFQHDDSFKVDRDKLNGGITALQRYSLIKRNGQKQTLSLHRLVQAVLIDALSPDLQKQWRDRVVQALNAAFPEPDFKEWPRCERLLSHVLVCAACLEYELTPTIIVADLYYRAGIYLSKRGQYFEAEVLLDQVDAIYSKHFGHEHLKYAYICIALANLYGLHGGHGRLMVEVTYRRALEIFEKQLGDEHPDIVISLYNLALIYMEQGRYEQAIPLGVRVISIQEKHLPDDHPDIVMSLDVLAAYCYHHQGDYKQAESFYREALRIREKYLGAEHPNVAVTLHKLAAVMNDKGKHEQAEELYQRALHIQECQLGVEHPVTQSTRKDYGIFLHNIRHDVEAAGQTMNTEPQA